MRSTLSLHQYQKPPFDPKARYVPARDLLWGNADHGYVTIPAAREDDIETVQPLDFEKMKPPVDETIVARLYRTGFLAMLLTDDGKPLINKGATEPVPESQVVEQEKSGGAICPKCGRQFKSTRVPHFHTIHCGRKAA